MINGLHTCKKEHTPYVGDVKTFILENRTSAKGVAWTKIRSAPASAGGQPYEVMAVTATDFTDAHGNVSFNLDIEPQGGGDQNRQSAPQTSANAPAARSDAGSGWEDRSSRIERQHSQEMALRYFAMVGGFPEGTKPTDALRDMTSWFQRDITHSPEKEGEIY